MTTNRLQIGDSGGKGTVTVAGATIINPNHPGTTKPNACQIQAGSALVSDSVIFNSATDAWSKTFYIYGTVTTNRFSVSAEDGYVADVRVQNKGSIVSPSGEAGTGALVIGKNASVNAGSYGGNAANAGTIKVNTEVNSGGTLHVYQNATIEGDIILNGGSVIIEPTFDQNASLSLQEAAIVSDITVNSGELNILGDCQTGNITLNGGDIYFGEDVTAAADSMALNDKVTTVTTGALTLNSGTIYIADNYIIDLGESDLVLSENVNIVLSVASLDNLEGITLFETTGNTTGLEDLTVTFVDKDGETKEMAVAYNNGAVVTTTIPEPTTATLSLLALAGLAARRRRK
ncbi:MAG: PEP-CTERM sorting domain-containing protein [Akkermansia sp.]|nr:PEP-CTERM sorting domain-containing protein [Akkermansia sp.]